MSRYTCERNSDNCKICQGINCNTKKEFQRCISCNSTDDIECIGKNTLDKSILCEAYDAACITGLDKLGNIHRDCVRHIFNDPLPKRLTQYVVSSNNNGNDDIYPPYRLKCYQCGNSDDCDFMYPKTKNSKLSFCNVYSGHEECYAYLDEGIKLIENFK